jgi:hypothetical protein
VSRVGEDGEIHQVPQYEKKISYNIDLSDGTSIRTDSIDDVFRLPNGRNRSITSISLGTPILYESIQARVRLNNSRYIPVSYDLSGEYRKVTALADTLNEHLPGLRRWYSPVTRLSFVTAFFVLCFGAYFLVLLLAATDFLFPSMVPGNYVSSGASDNSNPLFAVLLVVTLLSVVLFEIIDRAVKRLFPIATFAISQGADRDRHLNAVRIVVITVILIPFLLGLLINAIP